MKSLFIFICMLISYSAYSQEPLGFQPITDFPKYFRATSIDYGVMEITIIPELINSPNLPSWFEGQTTFYAVQVMTQNDQQIAEIIKWVLDKNKVELSRPVVVFKDSGNYCIVVYREKLKL